MSRPQEQKKPQEVEEELIVRRSEIPVMVEPGVFRTQLVITFYSETIPPTTIFMWKDEWTPEKEREEIRKAIEEAARTTEERVKVRISRG